MHLRHWMKIHDRGSRVRGSRSARVPRQRDLPRESSHGYFPPLRRIAAATSKRRQPSCYCGSSRWREAPSIRCSWNSRSLADSRSRQTSTAPSPWIRTASRLSRAGRRPVRPSEHPTCHRYPECRPSGRHAQRELIKAIAASDPHPFVKEAARLVHESLTSGADIQATTWLSESEVLGREHLSLTDQAVALVADVTLLLNLV